MIPRYSRPEMVDIWSPESKFRIWFEIEAHACDALAELGVIPKQAARTIWDRGGAATFDVERIDEIERETKHDVIAFLTHLAEIVGDDARFVHQGMTSSDVLDTCFNVQLVKATDILLTDIDALLAAIKRRALRTQGHGLHRPVARNPRRTGDLRVEDGRGLRRIRPLPRAAGQRPCKEIATCAISGAVGTFANIDPRVEGTCRQGHGASSRSRFRPR
jgi:adenylosuccinate lyase